MKEKYTIPLQTKLEIFGHGPWMQEPDQIHFTHAGIRCKIIRSPNLGVLKGVCVVPENHSLLDSQNIEPDEALDFEAHGKVFATYMGGSMELGFFCAEANDLIPRHDSIDNHEKTYRDVDYVRNKCMYLAEQLVEAHEPIQM